MKPNPLEFLRPVETIQVLDVGAARINETPIYEPLLDRDLAHLYACEGDDRQIANIKQHHGAKASIVSQFLGDGHRHESGKPGQRYDLPAKARSASLEIL